VHFHNAAWNALVYGKKAWVLVPPQQTVFSTVPAADMVRTLAKSDAALGSRRKNLRCVQEAGDVVFLARRWGHLTYNLAAGIGLAKEFTPNPWPPSEFSNKPRGVKRAQRPVARNPETAVATATSAPKLRKKKKSTTSEEF
jgi:hypothetical protein